jgi:hypothetical protein
LRKNLILILLVMAVVAVMALLVFLRTGKGEVAVITVDSKVVKTIDLETVTGTETFTITTEEGDNVIEAEHNRIRVKEADCPDGICVNTGWITAGDLPIVCLPHKLVITVTSVGEAKQAVDGVAG